MVSASKYRLLFRGLVRYDRLILTEKRGIAVKIEPIHDGCLRVWLAEEELEQWSLLDPHPDRRRIRRLVRRVLDAVGRDPGRVTAELIPVMGGGVLLISPGWHREDGQPMVYRLEGDALLELWERWPTGEPGPVCALYEQGDAYWLAVYPDGPLSQRQQRLLSEYGPPIAGGEGAAAHAAEYGVLVGMGTLLTAGEPRPPEP